MRESQNEKTVDRESFRNDRGIEQMAVSEEIRKELFALRDEKYREFHSGLVPTVNPEKIIGVRVPALRKLAKELRKDGRAEVFLETLPHAYLEENTLHGVLISQEKDFEKALQQTREFVPYIDNWATCDITSPKIFKKHLPELLPEIDRWLQSEEEFTLRFGIGMLLQFYLDDVFQEEYLEKVAAVDNEAFYVKMMVAWFFATALAKQYDAAVPYLENHRLEKWTHNKTIQKAVESFRITEEQKTYLRTLRRK